MVIVSLNYIKNNIMKINKYKSTLFLLILKLFMFQFAVVAQKNTDSATFVNKKVVDIAYGKFSFDAVTSSISTVSGDMLKKQSKYTTGQSLYGMVPGLFVEEKALEPGSSSLNMYIRGKSTFGNASNVPLVYIDGFERDLSQLTVDDIESFSVLKDASSCLLYGARGANGVILITTKRGVEQKTEFTFSTEYGFQQPTKLPKFVPSSDYVKLYNQALDNDGLSNLKYLH